LGNYPLRHRNHQIESLSERFLKKCLPVDWVVNSFQIDYGIDFNCEITANNEVIGHNFTIQLKGKENGLGGDKVKVRIKKSTINRWLNRLEPTMIVCYVIAENKGYWRWFNHDTVDLTSGSESFSILLTNNLSEINWSEISKEISKIFSKRHLLYDTPKLDDQNKLGWESFFEKKYEKTCSIFYEIIKKNPNDPSILQALALSEFQMFNYQKALININKALQIEERDVFFINKASILVEIGSLNNEEASIIEAKKLFEKVINLGYESDAIFYNYGSALLKLKNYEEAIIYLKKAVKIDPNKSEIWNNLGNCYLILGQHELYMNCFNNALLINPNSAETLFSKGSSLFRNFGDTENGLKYMLEAAKKTERYLIDNPYVFFWIAEAYLTLKKYDEAETWNSKGLTYFSSDKFLLTQKDRIIRERENNR
jgi:tetratricopeptide (TPR) repeat protein